MGDRFALVGGDRFKLSNKKHLLFVKVQLLSISR
jgi:hypothetical protein